MNDDQANDWGHDVILCNHYLHNLALVPSYFVKNIGSSRKFVWIIYGDKGTDSHDRTMSMKTLKADFYAIMLSRW